MLRLNQVHKRYGRVKALNGLDLHIEKGKIYGFVGPNGAGKTTTMKIVAGLIEPDQGEVFIDGVKISGKPEDNRKLIGYMPDFFGVYDNLLVSEYMEFFADLYELSPEHTREKIEELLELVKLSDQKDKMVDSLSRGMKQRLCLARALIHDPKLLLLDEPASGMDPVARMQMKDILKDLSARGQTILISSHILPELAEICDEIGIISAGKMVKEGNLLELDQALRKGLQIEIRYLGEDHEGAEGCLHRLKEEGLVLSYERDGLQGFKIAIGGEEQEAASLLKAMNESLSICHFSILTDSLEELFKKAISEGAGGLNEN